MYVRTARELGALVRDRRQGLGISQTALAEKVRTTQARISRIEAGAPVGLNTMLHILYVLGLDIDISPTPPMVSFESEIR